MGRVGLDLRLSGHEPGARLAGVEGSPQGERHRHQLHASPRTGFRHRVADVGAHSLGRNHKLLGDMSAGVTKRDEGENLALARRQLAELRGRRRLLRRLYPDADDDRDSPPPYLARSRGVLDAYAWEQRSPQPAKHFRREAGPRKNIKSKTVV